MLKCTCYKCKLVEVFTDHKEAWLKGGWDFVEGYSVCGNCSVMPLTEEKDILSV